MENIKEQFARLYMELDLTDDQAAMIKKLQRDVDAALRQPPVSGCRQGDLCIICGDEVDSDYGSVCSDCDDSHLDD